MNDDTKDHREVEMMRTLVTKQESVNMKQKLTINTICYKQNSDPNTRAVIVVTKC